MNKPPHKLVLKLYKPVCFRCTVMWVKNVKSVAYSTATVVAERLWDHGYAPCNFSEGTKSWSTHEPPPKKCPYKFEHGVAAAREGSS